MFSFLITPNRQIAHISIYVHITFITYTNLMLVQQNLDINDAVGVLSEVILRCYCTSAMYGMYEHISIAMSRFLTYIKISL